MRNFTGWLRNRKMEKCMRTGPNKRDNCSEYEFFKQKEQNNDLFSLWMEYTTWTYWSFWTPICNL